MNKEHPETEDQLGSTGSAHKAVVPSADPVSLGLKLLMLACLVGIAFTLRTTHLSKISFWYDEACSWRISQFPIPEMLDAVSRDAHPPLYYFLIKAWGNAFGNTPIIIRGFSVLCGMATVVAAWWFGAAVIDRQATKLERRHWFLFPCLAAAAIVVSPLNVEMSHEARPYTLGALLSLLTGTFILRATRPSGRWWHWIGFALAAAALTMTHYYGTFTVLAVLIFATTILLENVWRDGFSREFARLSCGIIVSVWMIQLVWLPWLNTFFIQQQRANAQLWMSPLDWATLSTVCWRSLAGGKESDVWNHWTWAAVVAWAGVSLTLTTRGSREARLIGLSAGIPLLAAIAYSLLVRNILGIRYLIFAQTYLIIGCVYFAWTVRLPFPRLLLSGLLIGWSTFWCWKYGENRDFQAGFSGTQEAVSFLEEGRGRKELVIVSSPFVYVMMTPYLQEPMGVVVNYRGDHRTSVLEGPPLREDEYSDVRELLEQQCDRIWTVDAAGLFGEYSAVQMPSNYTLIGEERFPQRYGLKMDILVRQYRNLPRVEHAGERTLTSINKRWNNEHQRSYDDAFGDG